MQIHAPFVGASSSGGGSTTIPWAFAGNFSHTFFSSDALSIDLILGAIPANTVLEAIRVVTREAFVAPGMTYYNIQLGVFGNLTLYADAYDAHIISTRKLAWVFDETDSAGWNVRIGAASDASLDSFTAGSLDIWLKYWTLPAAT